MHVPATTIGGIPPFTDPVEFKFDERVNVFIGPNGSGKTTLLKHLLKRSRHAIWNGLTDAITVVIPAMRSQYVDRKHDSGFSVSAYLNREYMYDFSVEMQSSTKDLDDVLSGNDVQDIANWMSKFIDDSQEEGTLGDSGIPIVDAADQLRKAIDISFMCAREICQEIIIPSPSQPKPTDEVVTSEGISGSGLPIAESFVELGMSVPAGYQYDANAGRTVQYIVGGLPMQSLSSGTEGTLWWTRWIALNLLVVGLLNFSHWQDWEERPAILLIDEIENHLHPTWQRRVIPALLEHFPGLQIFATTHSPFVVAGLKAGQVHLLNRDANGVVTATTNTEDIVGWTADEILRTMMGVQDPTDDETARNAAELRQLRDEGPRATPGEEEERQKRMQQLRRLVDRDLLAGGPKARRREDFARRFREAMERQRQGEELNQDNG